VLPFASTVSKKKGFLSWNNCGETEFFHKNKLRGPDLVEFFFWRGRGGIRVDQDLIILQYSPPQGLSFFFGRIWPNHRPTPSCKNPSPGFFILQNVFEVLLGLKFLSGIFKFAERIEKNAVLGEGENTVVFNLVHLKTKTFRLRRVGVSFRATERGSVVLPTYPTEGR